ncbi:MAG: DUF502 domain-containing protein [Gemmataceae bacterium]
MANYLKTTWSKVLGFFVTGALAVLPLVITISVVIWVATFLENFIGPGTPLGTALQELGLKFASDTVLAYFIGWLVVLLLVFGLGVLVSLGAQRIWDRLTNSIIRRIPVVGGLYETAEQLVGMFKKRDASELSGMTVVFCVFGTDHSAGILALMPSPEKYKIDGKEYQVVIVPTAPVPFGGALMFIPVEFVKPADISVDGLMSIYVSMGVTVPQYIHGKSTEEGITASTPTQGVDEPASKPT